MLARAEALLESGAHQQAHALCVSVLAEDERNPQALLLIGLIASEHGNFAKGADLFERALALGPNDARTLAHYAKALVILHRGPEALAAIERALVLAPADALTLDTIGVALSRLGLHERASALFAQAVALSPDNASFHFNHAVSQQFSGRFSQAEASYRKAHALDPSHHRGLAAIPHLGKQTRESNVIPALEAALGDVRDEASALHLGHALSKSLEDIGDYPAALQRLNTAKQHARNRLPAAESRDRAIFEAAMRTTSAPRAAGFQTQAPVFIVGLPRTGTTLTDRILSSHPNIVSAGELGNFALIVKRAAGGGSRFVLDAETLDAARGLDPAAIGRAYIESARPRTGDAVRFIDKMPLNFFYAGLIHRALPQARIICLRRNPMDSCLSNYRQLLATGPSNYDYTFDLAATARYYTQFDRLIAHWRGALPRDRFTEVQYETLVQDPETEARKLTDFVGVNWDARCLDFHRNEAPVATASSVQVRSPLYATSIGRWRRYGGALAPLRAALEAEGIEVAD